MLSGDDVHGLNPLKAGQNSDEKACWNYLYSNYGLNPLKAGQNSDLYLVAAPLAQKERS